MSNKNYSPRFFIEYKQLCKFIILLILLSTQSTAIAQVIVVLQQPPPYQFKVENMWKVTLINPTNTTYKVYLKGTATESLKGPIVAATTASFLLPPGLKIINTHDLMPLQIESTNSKYSDVVKNIGGVPTGEYEICVAVINTETGNQLGMQCMQAAAQNLSQIEILQPENGAVFEKRISIDIKDYELEKKISPGTREGDTVENYAKKISPGTREGDTVENYAKKISPGTREGDTTWTDPIIVGNQSVRKNLSENRNEAPPILTFSWLPPSPIPPGVRATYSIKITEIYGNQSSYDAVLSNPAFFKNQNIYSNVFLYPVAGRRFQNNKRYAWKVNAYLNNVLVSESETYEFSFTDNSKKNLQVKQLLNIPDEAAKVFHLRGDQSFLSYKQPLLLASTDNSQLLNMIYDNKMENEIKPFSFSGNAKLSFDAGYKSLPFSELPKNILTAELNPSVAIYGLPFTANFLISTQQGSGRQSINSFSFNFDLNSYKEQLKSRLEDKISELASGWEKLLLGINTLGIGTNYPSYSDYTLKGVPVTGINVELNPGIFYAAFAASKNQRSIENIAYQRSLYAGRLGIGKKDLSHFFFTGLYAKDDENSTTVLPDNLTLTPKANYVLGTETKLTLFDELILIEGEGNVSVLTRDTRDADFESKSIPNWIKKMITPKISTSFDYSYTGKMSFNNPGSATRISFGMKMIGPGYASLGAPNLRNDQFAYEGKVEQGLLARKISISSFFRTSHDNLIEWKSSTTTTTAFGINLGLNFPKLPFLQVSYSPYIQKNNNQVPSHQIENKTIMFSAVTGYTLLIEEFNFLTNVAYIRNEAKTLNGLSDYRTNSVSVTEAISFDKPISFAGTWGIIKTTSPYYYSNINSFDFSINAAFMEFLSNTLGLNIAYEWSANKKTGVYLNTAISILENINLNARLEETVYKDLVDTSLNYNELIFNVVLNVTF
ncbi:MAG: hypothetical protein NTX22_08655 [Ignavibacteriales bacterium]|nr:hypothetical protein [Ignavibacteriales bacterium]